MSDARLLFGDTTLKSHLLVTGSLLASLTLMPLRRRRTTIQASITAGSTFAAFARANTTAICAKSASGTNDSNAKHVCGMSEKNGCAVSTTKPATISAATIAITTAAAGKRDKSAAGKAARCLQDRKRKLSADASFA